MNEPNQHLRLLEATIFASAEPMDEAALASRLPDGADVGALLGELRSMYANRGVNLVRVGANWAFRTAPDLAGMLRLEAKVSRRLSRAAVEVLAIVAYHQPITRAEIEAIRGVGLSRGTLDTLMEAGWVRFGRRRRSPGRPLTWVTTAGFLDHFGIEDLKDLPGIDELKAAGLLDPRPAIDAYRPMDEDQAAEDAGAGEGREDEEAEPTVRLGARPDD